MLNFNELSTSTAEASKKEVTSDENDLKLFYYCWPLITQYLSIPNSHKKRERERERSIITLK